MTEHISERVACSFAPLGAYLRTSLTFTDTASPLMKQAYDGLREAALGGKHLRSHSTLQAAVGDQWGDNHTGTSVAIGAGGLGLAVVFDLLCSSIDDAARVNRAMTILAVALKKTAVGELLGVTHAAAGTSSLEHVRASNNLKTSEYSFNAPLKLSALAAGGASTSLAAIGKDMRDAYQAADDNVGSVVHTSQTGRTSSSDLAHNRATSMTVQLSTSESNDHNSVIDAANRVAEEGLGHLETVRGLINDVTLEVKRGSLSVCTEIHTELTDPAA